MENRLSRPLLARLSLLLLFLLAWAPGAFAAEGGYLLACTRGEGLAQGEQIYFVLSQDGFRWEALNGGKPALVSTVGLKGVRDPFLLRAQNGNFYLMATDLCIYLNKDWRRAIQAGSKSLVLWESTDLVHWSEPRLATVAAPDAGCAWAPEAIFDASTEKYLVLWASKSKFDNFAKMRIWGAWTKDFKTFGDPFIYFEKSTEVSDIDIIRGDDDKYYRFYHDSKVRGIVAEVSNSIIGDWRPVPSSTLGQFGGTQGPACYPLNLDENGVASMWCLMLDSGAEGYKPYAAPSLANGKFTPLTGFTFPFPCRQGSVLTVSQDEFERLKKAYP